MTLLLCLNIAELYYTLLLYKSISSIKFHAWHLHDRTFTEATLVVNIETKSLEHDPPHRVR